MLPYQHLFKRSLKFVRNRICWFNRSLTLPQARSCLWTWVSSVCSTRTFIKSGFPFNDSALLMFSTPHWDRTRERHKAVKTFYYWTQQANAKQFMWSKSDCLKTTTTTKKNKTFYIDTKKNINKLSSTFRVIMWKSVFNLSGKDFRSFSGLDCVCVCVCVCVYFREYGHVYQKEFTSGNWGHVWTLRTLLAQVWVLGKKYIRGLKSIEEQRAVCLFVAPVTLISGHRAGAFTQTEERGHTAAVHTSDRRTSAICNLTSSLK